MNRVFSPKSIERADDDEPPPGDESTDVHPKRSNRGVLRAKIEAGEGTIPVANLSNATGKILKYEIFLHIFRFNVKHYT